MLSPVDCRRQPPVQAIKALVIKALVIKALVIKALVIKAK